MATEEKSSPIYMRLIFFLLFDAPSTHLTSLRELYVDRVIYVYGWQKYMGFLCSDWHNMIIWVGVLIYSAESQ
jgi:hypothetical protein